MDQIFKVYWKRRETEKTGFPASMETKSSEDAEEEPRFPCLECGQHFRSKKAMFGHLRTHRIGFKKGKAESGSGSRNHLPTRKKRSSCRYHGENEALIAAEILLNMRRSQLGVHLIESKQSRLQWARIKI